MNCIIIEQIGTYNPAHVNAPEVKIDEELALKWLKDGAKHHHVVNEHLQLRYDRMDFFLNLNELNEF
jgi:ribosomal protein S16